MCRYHQITFAIVASLVFVFLSILAYGEIPRLLDVPSDLPDIQRDKLAKLRAVLIEERNTLKARVEAHNKKYAPKNSVEYGELEREAEQLKSEMQKHIQASKEYNLEVRLNQRSIPGQAIPVIDAPITNDENNRSAYNYAKVIDQFKVETSRRYEPYRIENDVPPKTWCNIFVQDVTRAMNTELPADKITDEIIQWLNTEGTAKGWKSITNMDEAQKMANEGHPTIAIIPGHAAIIRPGSVGLEKKGVIQPAIAQAGGNPHGAKHIRIGFTENQLKNIQFWFHKLI